MTTPAALGFVSPTGDDWAKEGDNAITTNALASAAMYDTLKTYADAAAWRKDVTIAAGDSFANYIGVTAGKQVKGRVINATQAADIGDWPAGLAYQGAKFISEGLASNVSLQQLQTYSVADPQLFIRAAVGTGGQAWVRVGGPVNEVGVAGAIPATQNLFLLDAPGGKEKTWELTSVPVDWEAQNFPAPVRGSVHMVPIGSSRIMTLLSWEPVPRLFAVQRSGTTWGEWSQIGAQSTPPAASSAAPASGMKIAGVPLTAGHFGSEGELEQCVRMPMRFEAPAFRFRVGFQHINTRSGLTRNSAISITNIRYGDDAGNGAFASGSATSLGGVTVPADGKPAYTKWANIADWTGLDKLLGFGYTATAAPWAMLGHAYKNNTAADATVDAPAGMVRVGLVPCTIWLEVETYATTPVVASFGDSNSVGVGATRSVYDSWLSQLTRRIKALPVHLGSSGDSCNLSLDGTGYKYTRFSGLSRPDAVIMAMGQNDAAADGVTSAEILPKIDTVLANLAASVSPNVYAVNYMPRTSSPWAGFEPVRRALTAYLDTEPGPVRDVFDIAAAISSDDETIRPEFDSSDGTHLNADGFTAVQAAISRPVTTPPALYEAL